MGVRFPLEKFLLCTSAALLLFLFSLKCSEAKPHQIKRSNKLSETFATANENETNLGELVVGSLEKGFHDRAREIQCLTSGISSMFSNLTSSFTSILGNVKNSTSGLGNLMKKPGGFNITSLFSKPAGGCDPIDKLLLANIPGIFFWTPIVILLVSIMFGIIAAIVVAIGGLGSHISEAISELMKDKMNPGGYEESSYGAPSSSYGSSSYSNSRLETVDQLTNNFSQAYDKYSALSYQTPQKASHQTDQRPQQIVKDYYDNQSQYDQWNQIAKARRG